jgi:hypothetical protein
VVASTAGTMDGKVSDGLSAITPTLPFMAFAIAAGIVATLLAFPSAGRGVSPEALHHE